MSVLTTSSSYQSKEEDVLLLLFFSIFLGILFTYLISRYCTELPYTVAVFCAGVIFALSFQTVSNEDLFKISVVAWEGFNGDLILYTFLPALLFAHSSALNFHRVKENLISAMLLAFPGGVCFAVATAVFAKYVFPYHWGWNLSFLFGAMTCASDPIAILGLLNSVGASLDMTYLIILESLLSDGTALILYELFYELVKDHHHDHHYSEETLRATDVVIYFVKVITLSPLVGIAVSFASILTIGLANMRSKAADTTIQLATTFCCAYFSFYIAQRVLRVSGVIACCTSGILLSRYATPRYVKAETIESVWHAMEWLGNTILFYLAGLIIGNYALSKVVGEDVLYVFIVYLFFVGMRYLIICCLYPALYIAGKGCTTIPEATFLGWSGMKGASSIALSVAFYQSTQKGETTVSIRNADRLIFLVGGVVALTLFINATASKLLLLRLHLLEEEAPVTKGTVSKRGDNQREAGKNSEALIRKQLSMKRETKVMYEYLQKKIRLKAYNLLEQLIPATTEENEEGNSEEAVNRNAFMSGKSTSTILAKYLDVDFIFRHCTLLRESPEAAAFLRSTSTKSGSNQAADDSYFQPAPETEDNQVDHLPVTERTLHSTLLSGNHKSKKDAEEEQSEHNSSTKEDISVTDCIEIQREVNADDDESPRLQPEEEDEEGKQNSNPSSSQRGSRKVGSTASGSRMSRNPYQLKENELNDDEEEDEERNRIRNKEEEDEEEVGGGYYVENLSTKENISKIDYEAIQQEIETMKREEETKTNNLSKLSLHHNTSLGTRTAPASVKVPHLERQRSHEEKESDPIKVRKSHSSAALNNELLMILKDSVSVNPQPHHHPNNNTMNSEENNTIRVKKSLSSASLENRKRVKLLSPRPTLEPLASHKVVSTEQAPVSTSPPPEPIPREGEGKHRVSSVVIPPPPLMISLPPSIVPPSDTITSANHNNGLKAKRVAAEPSPRVQPPKTEALRKKSSTASMTLNNNINKPSRGGTTPRSPLTQSMKHKKPSMDHHSTNHTLQRHHSVTPRTPAPSFESLIADKLHKLQQLRHGAKDQKEKQQKKEKKKNAFVQHREDLGEEVEEEVLERLSGGEEEPLEEEEEEEEDKEPFDSTRAVQGFESVRHPETPRGSPTSEILETVDLPAFSHHDLSSSPQSPSKEFSGSGEDPQPSNNYLHASYRRVLSFSDRRDANNNHNNNTSSLDWKVVEPELEEEPLGEEELLEEEEMEEEADDPHYVAKRLSFRMLHHIIYDNLLITMRKVFLEVLRVNYFKQINSDKLPRKSLAAILLLNSIDISFHRIQLGVDQPLQDFEILLENHHYLSQLSQGRQIVELERYHYHYQASNHSASQKKKNSEAEDNNGPFEEEADSQKQPPRDDVLLHHQLHHHYAYSIHLHTVVILLISLIEAHEFAQSRIAFYLHEGGGHIDTPEQDMVITESQKQVLHAKRLLLMIDEPMITYIYSKRILFSILSLEQNVVEDYQREGIIATKYADFFYSQIEEDMNQLQRLERSKLLYHQQYSVWALVQYVTEYYFEEWINVAYNWKDYYYERMVRGSKRK